MFKFPLRPCSTTKATVLTLRSASLLSTLFGASKMSEPPKPLNARTYTPKSTEKFPYGTSDMLPMDPGNDGAFYAPPRFVTHIDDNAIINLKRYYDETLPTKGVILDFCSSWISHYPPRIHAAAEKRDEHRSRGEVVRESANQSTSEDQQTGETAKSTLIVLGTGMNQAELAANPVLKVYSVQDLNEDSDVRLPKDHGLQLNASTCVVSIDYLTKPVDVLSSIHSQTVDGGSVHLAISNRCFPTKVVGRWLRVSEQERLEMVGDYLWWAGWRDIEIVEVVKGSFMKDPLWVVRAKKV